MKISDVATRSSEGEHLSPHVDPTTATPIDQSTLPKAKAMTAYAIGQLRNVRLNEGIVAYLRGIDATLEPFGGRFIIHGGRKEVLEGAASDDLVVIGFPTIEAARSWYASPAYQSLISLRTQGAEADIFLMQGVDESHRAIDILQ
jgi:uncharacterized protein (DUF1330 family)